MKQLIKLILLIVVTTPAFAQQLKTPTAAKTVIDKTITKNDLKHLRLMEDTLHRLSNSIVYDSVAADRRKACYSFIPKLVQALKTPNSFFYPFDSFETISKIYPPDSTFRVLTWQLFYTVPFKLEAQYSKTGRDTTFQTLAIRYYGVIQMRSKELKIFPLFDASDTLSYGTQQILNNNNWWGQLYYNVIQNTAGGKNYYTLFGYEAPDAISRRKIIDILSFDEAGKPHFGAPIFYINHDTAVTKEKDDTLTRFFIEYKHDASTVLNYDPELKMIVFDHVAPPNGKAKGATFAYLPDGTYEGFFWDKDHWQWVEKVFNFAINEDDNPPIPMPLFGTPKKQPVLPKDGEDPR